MSFLDDDEEEDIQMKIKVDSILPLPGDVLLDFGAIDCIIDGPSVDVVTDSETGKDALEVNDGSSASFPCQSSYRFLCLHLKNLDKFVHLTIFCQCSSGQIRQVVLTNKRSNVKIEGAASVFAPIVIGSGWQYVNVDLDDILLNSFGTHFLCATQVTISGSARVSKLFFQDEEYSDAELPPYLRLVQ